MEIKNTWDSLNFGKYLLQKVYEILGEFEAQIINYLHVSNHKLGLLLNFGATSLQYKWYPNEWHHRQSASIG